MRNFLKKIFNKKNIPYFVIFGLTAAVAVLDNTAAAKSLAPVNEFFIRILGFLSSLAPFSLLGILVVSLIPLTVLIVWLFVLSKRKIRFLFNIICVVCVCLILFYCTIGFNYSKDSVYDTMNLDVSESADSELLEEAAEYYLAQLNEASEKVEFYEGHSVSPNSFDETSEIIMETYRKTDIFDFLYDFDLRPKQFYPSFVMNYTGTAGIFFPIFAEINVCANLPDRNVAPTLAHEIAHSKGVMNEGECNFIAEIICINCDDDYIRYSGLTNVFARLANQLRKLDSDKYDELISELNPLVLSDYAYANAFYEQFEGALSELSDKINDRYLKNNDVSGGTESYSQAVNGILAYYREYVRSVDNG